MDAIAWKLTSYNKVGFGGMQSYPCNRLKSYVINFKCLRKPHLKKNYFLPKYKIKIENLYFLKNITSLTNSS